MINDIVNKIHRIIASGDDFIALHEPKFNGNELLYVKECIDTGWVSTAGKFVDLFEKKIAEFTGANYAIATSSGTAALHVSYLLADVKRGDEVLVPTLTFVGTTNPLIYCGAIPHFIDADEKTLGIDTVSLDSYLSEITKFIDGQCINRLTSRPIRALCVMHSLGHPVDLDPIVTLCQKFHLNLIEDAAEAMGSYYKGVHVGHRGMMGILSFNGNKVITAGGGGAIITNDSVLAKRAKHLTTTAKLNHPWIFQHDEVGYNYRLPNLNAALGCAQLEQLPDFLAAKRVLAKQYIDVFSNFKGCHVLEEPSYAKSNYWLNAIVLNNEFSAGRDKLIEALNAKGLMSRPLWDLQHTLPMFQDCPRMPVPIAENLQKRVVKIPSSPHLTGNSGGNLSHINVHN